MRTYYTNTFMTIAEYRQLAERWARQIAEERRVRKMKPSRVLEVFTGPGVTANIIDDGDYG